MFEVGDKVECINDKSRDFFVKGEVYNIDEVFNYYCIISGVIVSKHFSGDFKLVNNPKWHKHHDLIIAWAKGAKIQSRIMSTNEWSDCGIPGWYEDYDYRIKPTKSDDITKIEQEMRELAKKQEELANQLKKLQE